MIILRKAGITRKCDKPREYELAKLLVGRYATNQEQYEELLNWTTEYLGY